ncbi:MAG: helix-turn-helix domain-containing protein [Candidatus ainarchaeum sp.]|nr:helix-turn-helix domain-containing protein [Candidatus ainarchaeum sp.]
MWVARIRVRHDCVVGNRCRQFNVTTAGISFDVFREQKKIHAPQIQVLSGKEEDVKAFIEDLKKDRRITNFEQEGNSVFFVETRQDMFPSAFNNPKLIFSKPVTVDAQGFEYWEVASWKKETITEFIKKLRISLEEVLVEKIKKTKLTDVYFLHVSPKLSPKQKRALELALESGYYEWPKRTDFAKLAKAMKVTIQTYREHLKKAEQKIMPNLAKSI